VLGDLPFVPLWVRAVSRARVLGGGARAGGDGHDGVRAVDGEVPEKQPAGFKRPPAFGVLDKRRVRRGGKPDAAGR
jgi:hypothetical protein